MPMPDRDVTPAGRGADRPSPVPSAVVAVAAAAVCMALSSGCRNRPTARPADEAPALAGPSPTGSGSGIATATTPTTPPSAPYPPPESRLHDAIEGLPGGAFAEPGAGWSWGAPGEPFRVDVVALREADGTLDVGVVASDAATSRLVWSLGRDGRETLAARQIIHQPVFVEAAPAEPAVAEAGTDPIRVADTAALATAGDGRRLVVLRRTVVAGPGADGSAAGLPRPDALAVRVLGVLAVDGMAFIPTSPAVHVSLVDWAGDGRAGAVLSAPRHGTAVLYADADAHPAVPAARLDWPSQLVDIEGDGRHEIVTPAGDQWRVEAWDGQAFVAAAPLPAVLPAPAAVADGSLPPLPRDLLFLRGQEIWRWPRGGGALARVMGDPGAGRTDGWQGGPPRFTRFQVAHDGGQIAYPLGRFEKAGAERYDVEVTELFVFDPATSTTTRVAADIPDNLPDHGAPSVDFFAITPHGSAVVFVGPPRDADRFAGAIYAAPVADPAAARVLADCGPSGVDGAASRRGCGGLLLAPTGDRLAFADAGGLHVVDLAGGPSRTLAASVPETQMGVEGIHRPRSWAPDGRHLISTVGYFEGNGNVVWDVASGEPRDLEAFEYVGPGLDLGWLSDGSAVLEARDGAAPLRRLDLAAGAEGSGWRPVLGFLAGPRDADAGGYLALAPHGLPDGDVGFMLRQSATDLFWGNGVFRVGPDGRGWRPIAALPVGAADENGRFRYDLRGQVTWTPDGAAFVFVDLVPADGSIRSVLVGRTTGGDAVWDATGLVGPDGGFAWGAGR